MAKNPTLQAKELPTPSISKKPTQEIDLSKFKRGGKVIFNSPFRAIAKLEGKPGAGKTLFYLSEIHRAIALGFKSEEILIYILDFLGSTGVTDILQRKSLFPSEYVESIVHVICPSITVGEAALQDFIASAKDKKFIVLVIEGDHKVFEVARDEYTLTTRGIYYDKLIADACTREVSLENNFKIPFDESIRDAYAYINMRYLKFIETTFAVAESLSCNYYLTAHIDYKTKNWGVKGKEYQQLVALGKPQYIDGYFNFLLRLFTVQEDIMVEVRGGKKVPDKNTRYLIDSIKGRRSRTGIFANNGAKNFWEIIENIMKQEKIEDIYNNTKKEGDKLETEIR